MALNFDVFISALTGTGLAAFLFKILEKNYDEHLFDKRSKKLNKKDLTDEIIKICSEARSSQLKKFPRNIEHIEFVISKVYFHNKTIADQLDEFVSTWKTAAKLHNGKKLKGIDDDVYDLLVENYYAEAKNLIKILLQKIKKW